MHKILVCGDSFAYDHGHTKSWITQLGDRFCVTNLAQCGCGEYKILKQILSVDLVEFDHILLFHTSANRLYLAERNPIMKEHSHRYSDLLFSDVEAKKEQSDLARVAYEFFVLLFDVDYHAYVHDLICADIDRLTEKCSVHHFTGFDYSDRYQFRGRLTSLHDIWVDHPGEINHFSPTGNQLVLDRVLISIADLIQTKSNGWSPSRKRT